MSKVLQVEAKARQRQAPTFAPARTGFLQRCGADGCAPGKCDERRKERLLLQRRPANQAEATVPPIVEEVLRSPGQPLGPATRTFMESRFGHDFSRVRVHTGPDAARAARDLSAEAFTVGQDICFAHGRYSPQRSSGRQTLAHELAHAIQQLSVSSGGTPAIQRRLEVDEPIRHGLAGSRGHDFGQTHVFAGTQPAGGHAAPVNLNADDDETAVVSPGDGLQPSNEEPSSREEEVGQEEAVPAPFIALGGKEAPLQTGGAKANTCPTSTSVEKTVDMTPEGIKMGYRTGYGAAVTMRVGPDSQNWNGTKIVESLKQTKSTCPREFGISPCSGSSTFTVGAEGRSSVLGTLPATRNRFYDFHVSRWNRGSLLHDPARNPKGLDSCEATCEQQYSCSGKAIGKHTIVYKFTKGRSDSRDVTLVNVSKS